MHRTLAAIIATLAVAASACGTSDEQGRATTDTTAVPDSTTAVNVARSGGSAATTADASSPPPAPPEPVATPPTTATPSTTALGVEAERPYDVSTSTFTLVDTTRATPATETSGELPARTIDVLLHLPDTDRPVPLVVFSHGLGGHPDLFEHLLGSWAESGYAVAAPVFPLTNRDGVDFSIADGINQPADVSFVLDQIFDVSTEVGQRVAEHLDPHRVGAAGLSFGGATTYEVAMNDRARDTRISAAIIMAGVRFTNSEDGSFVVSNVPVYLLHSSADRVVPIDVSRNAYRSFGDNTYFATLLGGGHAGPFEDETAERPKVPGMDAVVAESTTAFWDRYLLDDAEAADRLTASANVEGLSVLAQKDLCALGLIGDGGYADEAIGSYIATSC